MTVITFGRLTMQLSLLDVLDPFDEYEQCGLLIGERRKGTLHWYITDVVVVKNYHPDPHTNFRILQHDAIEPSKGHIVGIVHTHPVGALEGPSQADLDGLKRGYFGVVYAASGLVSFFDHGGVITTRRK